MNESDKKTRDISFVLFIFSLISKGLDLTSMSGENLLGIKVFKIVFNRVYMPQEKRQNNK